jgi:hypothetical protein
MTDAEPVGNARVAADLAAAGFSVFPCHAGGEQAKRPMPGVFWRSQSTSDRTKVAGWWKRWPDAAIGLDLAKSGLIVIDADRHGEDDGVAAIAELMHQNQFDPNDAPVVGTPNAGTHFVFRQPPGRELGNGRGGLPAGIDVRGAGGYVIAAGTVMADGRRYEIFGSLADAPVLPGWLVDLISSPVKSAPVPVLVPAGDRPSDERVAAYVGAALEQELDAVRSAPKGQRNHQLNRSAFALGQLVGAGWITGAQVSAMLENAAAELAHDDGPIAVRKTIASGLRSGARDPRQMPESEYQTITAEDYAASAKLLAGMSKEINLKPSVPAGFSAETGAEEITSSDPIGGAVDQFDLPDSALRPPGVVGELVDWICDWSAEPIRIHALGAALVIVGTLLGRKVYTRTRPSCTALYVGAIAPSGMGKQHPMDCIRLALDEVCGNGSMHMGWNVSLPAIVVALQHQASKVMVADEFADKLIGLRSKNASTSQSAISEGLRSLWGTNTGTYSPDVSLNRGDNKIMRPALSFYGASTIKDFARSLVSKDVTNGLFNRFLLLPRFGEVAKGQERDGVMALPETLKQRLQWLHACLPPMQLTLAQRGDGYPTPILVPFSSEAEAINEANKALQQDMLRASDHDDALMLYGRFAEQAKRVATIIACGRTPQDLASVELCEADMAFATNLVRYSVDQFVTTVRRDMVESWVQAQHKLVLGIIRAAGEISRNELIRRIDGRIKGRDVEELIKTLVAGDNVLAFRVEPGPKGGRPKELFRFLRG